METGHNFKPRLSMNSDKRLFKQPVGNSMDCDEQDISANNQLVLHARTHKYAYTHRVNHQSSSDVTKSASQYSS